MGLYYCESCHTVRYGVEGDCGVCGNGDYSAVEMESPSDEYECDECGESFDSERGLNSHSRVHED